MGKILNCYNSHDVNFPKYLRIGLIALVTVVFGYGILNGYINDKEEKKTDTNIYLNEEVCFAKEVYIKVSSVSVNSNDDEYFLNLGIEIEQRSDDKLDKIKISPSNFALKSVNLESKSPMNIFFECMFKETVTAMLGGGIEGSINIIEETANFALDYTEANIENAIEKKSDFKTINLNDDAFVPFYPRDNEEIYKFQLTFPIKKEYLETKSVIVLAIDQWNHVEKHIFLIVRPDGNASEDSN